MNQALRVSPLALVSCLVSWVGISTLLMSPALAQVNGPGPSPGNLFDIVLNLPGDEAVVTGESYESIGGVPGQTTQLNVNDDGTVGISFVASSGSEVNISGGTVSKSFRARGGEVNISGGNVGLGFAAESGSVVNISGGTMGWAFSARPGSDVELLGGEFRLNGADFSGSTITLLNSDVFTGTLADGSSFIFGYAARDRLTNVSLTATALPAADLSPIAIDAPVASGPSGLRAGQTLTLQPGGSLPDDFAVVGATLNVEGGIVGDSVEVSYSVVNISGGTVGIGIDAFPGSQVNISGGTVGEFLEARRNSEVNISGGTVGYNIQANSGSQVNISGGTVGTGFEAGGEVNISGGTVGDGFEASDGSEVNISSGDVGRNFCALSYSQVNISGGSVGDGFSARSSSQVNITGSEFFIDNEELDTLLLGAAFTITDRDVELSGLLADGQQFSFQLNSADSSDNDFFDPFATLTVTLDSPVILGDVNLDGVVNFLDIQPFIGILSTGGFQAEADIDQNGVVNFLDIAPFIGTLSGN